MQPFSAQDSSARQILASQINQRWGQLYELEKDWGEKALKYLLLTNSGGAIATLSFLGASPTALGIVGAKIALSLFLVGLVLVGAAIAKTFHHMSNLLRQWKSDVESYYSDKIAWQHLQDEDRKRSVTDVWDYILPYGAFFCFIGGCIVGAYSLLSRVAG